MGQSNDVTTTPPETGSDVNITVNENNGGTDEQAPAESTETESNDSGSEDESTGGDSE